ncbi:hybrid sensor histidine kinase/response regulator transcription factor [Aquiflexum lacus]|uniref:hybrid sensor histidine kinase/response regulator transcription factor n=1 Tax=Aquiflexum lacus TaxID=2483805 RepID=UPI0018956C28|nr:hybrid sensor histidine kinase/response regulator transcription factor [Aquiflexum lacus]
MKHFSKIKKASYLIAIILILAIPVFGQTELSFRQLSVNDGLSQNSVVSVTQDVDGFLWIATQEGLNRFDGIEFKIYNKKFADITQESHLQLGKVIADRKNRIWIIPESSVPELLDPLKNEFIPIKGINAANSIHEDLSGNIWIGTFSGQLFKWNENIQSPEMIWTDPSRQILDISDFDTQQLILTFNDGVVLLNKQNQSVTDFQSPDKNNIYSCAITDSDGNIWIGTLNAGIWLVPKGEKSIKPINTLVDNLPDDIKRQMILDIMKDSKGRIWVATYGQGLIQLNTKDGTSQNYVYQKQNPRSVHYNDVLCLFEDYTGTLWFGTDGGGLSFHDTYLEKFNFFHNQQVPENINIDVVRALYVDEKDKIWVGTSGKGLTSFDPKTKTWETLSSTGKSPLSISSDRVMSLMGDGQGKLWIGYQEQGLSIMDLEKGVFKHFNTDSKVPLPSNTVWKIFKDSEGRFWLATRNDGLIQFDPQKGVVQQFNHDPNDPNSIPSNNIRAIEEGRKGQLWIGTENQGIASFDMDSGNFEPLSHQQDDPNSISSNSIKSLHFDGKNTLWIGTNGSGINALNIDSKEFTRISTKEGLANDVVYGILPDAANNIWLSSNKGITKITILPSQPLEYSITNYTNYDGLATEFNTGAYFKNKDGLLYFGSLEGFYWFNSEDISLNEIQPKTAITGLYAFDQPIPTTDKIKLKHNENTLTINMASLVFSSPDKNEFQYKLESHDENWIQAGNNHQARYTNLAPGSYNFLSKSSNYDGIWSAEPVSLQFTILPPWYLSIWAKLVYLVFFILAIVWIYQYLKWRWEIKFLIKMKEDEAERLMEIDRFKTNFFTNISHEFRTPLTLIAGPVERLMSQSENPVFKSQLNLIKQNSQRLLNLVDQLLEVSKIKSGKLQLGIRKGNMGLLLQSIVSNFFYFAAEKDIRIRTEIPLMTEVWFDPDKIEKIVGNLLQNAIKYGKSGTEVLVRSKIQENQLHLTISNHSMVKYSKEEISHLFDKFYKPDTKIEGFGIGLPLVKDLVELHKGKINLCLEDKDYFEVNIIIPVEKYSFRPEQVIEEEEYPEDQKMKGHQITASEDAPLVLLVEDNYKVRSFIIEELKPYYKIIEAENGREGLFLALKKIPDLIISDVMMPEMDGIELCQKLKSDEKTSHIPIILLTAKSEEDTILKGLQVGADDYMLKPFGIKQLLVRIQKLIELRRNLRIRYSGKTSIAPNEIAITSTDEKFLEKIQYIIDEDLGDANFTVDEFCKKLGMSRMQLHRKLTALTGLSTSAFIRDQRLRLALQRLEKSGESISEIAYAVGFSSPSYFIKCFKETYQMTPNEYLAKEK